MTITGSINWFREQFKRFGVPAQSAALAMREFRKAARKLHLRHRPQAPHRRRMRNQPHAIRSKRP